jgi:hypothetical protein
MSEVITRPITEAQRTGAPSKANAKVSPPTTSPDPIKIAFSIIQTLLNEVTVTVDQPGPRSEAARLLQIAHNIADEAMIRTPNAEDAVSVAFDIAALIRAAKRVPGAHESDQIRELLDQAAVQLNWLTKCDIAGVNCIETGQAQASSPPSASERTVAATGASLVGQAIAAINSEDGAAYAADLLKVGRKALQQASEGVVVEECIRDVFFLAAAVCTGALAIEQQESPSASHRHQLISTAFELLNNAGLSYDCQLHECTEAAAAINAGRALQQIVSPEAKPLSKPSNKPLTKPLQTERSTERARELANAAICHIEAAKTVLDMLTNDNACDEVHAVARLTDALWEVHASTDETEDIGTSSAGAFTELQRELSIVLSVADLVRQQEDGPMCAVAYLLEDASRIMEEALLAIPRQEDATA